MSSSVIVASTDPAVVDPVMSAAAATGNTVCHITEPSGVPRLWARAPAVIIGTDHARQLSRIGLPRHRRVYVAGTDQSALLEWSLPLHATPLWLPPAIDRLADIIAANETDGHAAPLIAVVGATGGAGTSTLAVGLALAANRPTLLIDADAAGGGIDLLMGLEAEPGWRWPALAASRGELGNLAGSLPTLDETHVVSMARGAEPVEPGAVEAVIRSGRRYQVLVVADLARGRDDWSTDALRLADRVVIVTPADVRGVAAARELVAEIAPFTADLGVAVRAVRGGLPGDVVADELGLPAFGYIPRDNRLSIGAVNGEPPDRAAGRRWRAACRRLLGELT